MSQYAVTSRDSGPGGHGFGLHDSPADHVPPEQAAWVVFPMHCPLTQHAPVGHVPAFWQHPLLQVSVVHGSPSLHWLFEVHSGAYRQQPLLHVSCVHELPSLHWLLEVH